MEDTALESNAEEISVEAPAKEDVSAKILDYEDQLRQLYEKVAVTLFRVEAFKLDCTYMVNCFDKRFHNLKEN